MENDVFCDSHVHMAEPGFGNGYSDLGSAGILMTCTAKPDEWSAQESIDDPRAVKFYGVHPWYADQWNAGTEESLISILDKGNHVGEIGLDSKRGTLDRQTAAFRDQIRIASEMDRIATIHMIATEKEILDDLRTLGNRVPRTVLHSYGSDSYVKPFSQLGCYMSVSPRILSRSETRVRRLLEAIPEDRLLLETDAPHSGRDFAGMHAFANRLASITGDDPETMMGTAYDNLRTLIG